MFGFVCVRLYGEKNLAADANRAVSLLWELLNWLTPMPIIISKRRRHNQGWCDVIVVLKRTRSGELYGPYDG